MKIVILILLGISLSASDIGIKLMNYYNKQEYKKACNYGVTTFNKFSNDESMISLYAFSCLKADYIDRLTTPIALLKKSKDSRKNAAYLAIILMQKKLLYYALIDNYPLNKVRLPSTDTLLSKIFELYCEGDYTKDGNKYYFKDKNNRRIHYKLFLTKIHNINKIVIEGYYDKILSEKHIYR